MIGKMKAFFEFEIFESRIFGGEGGGLENWWLDLSVGFFILLFIYLFYLFIFWGGVLGGGVKIIWSAYKHSISIVYRLSLFIVFCDF